MMCLHDKWGMAEDLARNKIEAVLLVDWQV